MPKFSVDATARLTDEGHEVQTDVGGTGRQQLADLSATAKFHELPILLIFGLGLPNHDIFDYFGLQGQTS